MSNHYRKSILKYRQLQKSQGCPFCDSETIVNAVYENNELYVVPNLTSYDLWELHDVVDHLLVVPKRHVKTLSELTQKEKLAIMNVYSTYEEDGYSIYARGKGFVKRSVNHQHSHLIKTTNKKPRIAFFIAKPYLLKKY